MAWEIDPSHSHVTFTVRHMMFAKVRGTFKKWSAVLELGDDPSVSMVRATIDASSIDTNEEKRDGHLRSADFFDVEKYPKIEFVSKRVSKDKLVGDLTMHGVTKEVALDLEEAGRGKDPWGQQRAVFHASGSINRGDFGLKWNQALEAGGVLVSDKVDIDIDVEAIQKA